MSTFSVVNTDSSGPGSLYQAILDANATTAADVIAFDIAGAGAHTITGALPVITQPVAIDGTSQPGYAGQPLVELSGNGLSLNAQGCRIEGLAITDSSYFGIYIAGPGKNVIQSNYIGVDPTGMLDRGNLGGGIYIAAGANDNIIGTNGDSVNDAAEGNVISGNGFINRRVPTGGIEIDGAHRNVIAGNLIGTDAAGVAPIYNASFGVSIVNGGQLNRIGTNGNGLADDLEGNVINGVMAGVYMADYGTEKNIVAGNLIGTDAAGSSTMHTSTGVWLNIGADHNRIGTDANGKSDSLERNVISGNVSAGVYSQSDFNTIAGNYIGVDRSGSAALPNGVGVQIEGWNNVVGGVKAAARNVISGNQGEGVVLQADSPKVQGNYIGVDATGAYAVPNMYGVVAYYGANVQIGGSSAGARNVISGNANDGIYLSYLYGPATIQGNYIGTDATGSYAVGNGTPGEFPTGRGIDVFSSDAVTIGGATASSRNVISGNVLGGVAIESTADQTTISGNYIGVNAAGNAAVGNLGPGVLLTGLISNTTIGGVTAGARNVISGNVVGVQLDGAANTNIQGNYIGADATGKLPLGNAAEGILLSMGAYNNTIGIAAAQTTPPGGAANVIAFNGSAGVALLDEATTGNTVRGNSIFNNGGLGIDLGNDGVSLPGAALLPNGSLAYPTLSKAVYGMSTRLIGSYSGPANATITLDFYSNTAADPTGYGEGKKLLGSLVITTDASGLATFDATLLVRTTAKDVISATATDVFGNTSEFSLARSTVRM